MKKCCMVCGTHYESQSVVREICGQLQCFVEWLDRKRDDQPEKRSRIFGHEVDTCEG